MKIMRDISVCGAGAVGQWSPGLLFKPEDRGAWFDPNARHLISITDGQEVEPGASVHSILSRRGYGAVAAQIDVGTQPILSCEPIGGRRNLLLWSENLDDPVWLKLGGVTVRAGGGGPLGLKSQQVQFADGDANSLLWHNLETAVEGPCIHSFWIRSSAPVSLRARVRINGSSLAAPVIEATPAWSRIEIARGAAGDIVDAIGLQNAATADSGLVEIAGHQFERGGDATPYQTVKSHYDVSEVGKRRLYSLCADDNGSLDYQPGFVSNAATFWSATEEGVQIATGQNISEAPINILAGHKTYSFGICDRDLADKELAALTNYLNSIRQESG